ncbi:MAG: DUF3618 domain-containing protein [Naasia sp.]
MTTDDQSLTHKERELGEIRSDIEQTRARLAETLDQIEDKLDVSKQAQKVFSDARDRFDKLRKENPVVLYSSAAIVVLGAVGTALVVRMVRR